MQGRIQDRFSPAVQGAGPLIEGYSFLDTWGAAATESSSLDPPLVVCVCVCFVTTRLIGQ